MNKKKIFIVAIAVCLIATISMGTLAWFTDEDKITNDFFVGDSTTDADEVFGIDLWETSDTNKDGVITDDETFGKDTKDTTGAKYEDILPGGRYDKNPYFTNTGIHGQYLRAVVTVTEADILKEAMTPKGADVSEWFDVPKFLPGTDAKWDLAHKFHTNKDTFVLVYYYTEVLEKGETTEKLFDDVVIPTELTKEQAAEMDNFSITIVGQVIQSENLADVANAKEAFKKYWDEEGVVAGVVIDKDLAVEGSTVSNASPLTGTVTAANTLIEYNPELYNVGDPNAEGVLFVSDLTGTVKKDVDMVTFPASSNNGMIVITESNFTVEEGGTIVNNLGGASNTVMFYGNVTINGVKVTRDNLAAMQVYFPNCSLYI